MGPWHHSAIAAESSAEQRAAAQALFDEARRLAAEGNHAEACPKLRESQRLDPSIGTLYNLGDCLEKTGRTASAWVAFREVADLARIADQRDRQRVATARADALEPRLVRLRIVVPASAQTEGLEVRRDGTVVGSGQWGVAVPVDPGRHIVASQAPGREATSHEVLLTVEGSTTDVELLPLRAIQTPEVPPTETAPPPPPKPAVAPVSVQETGVDGQESHGIPTATFVLAAVGVAGIGAGTVLAFDAKSKYDDSLAFCRPDDSTLCSSEGVSLRDDARQRGTWATVAMGAGAAALVGAAVVWWIAPADNPASSAGVTPVVGADGASLSWQGAF